MRATDSVNSTLNKLKFCTPLTNLIKMFGIETRLLSYKAHRTFNDSSFHFIEKRRPSEAHTQK